MEIMTTCSILTLTESLQIWRYKTKVPEGRRRSRRPGGVSKANVYLKLSTLTTHKAQKTPKTTRYIKKQILQGTTDSSNNITINNSHLEGVQSTRLLEVEQKKEQARKTDYLVRKYAKLTCSNPYWFFGNKNFFYHISGALPELIYISRYNNYVVRKYARSSIRT